MEHGAGWLPVNEVGGMEKREKGKPFAGSVGGPIIFANADHRGIRMIAGQDELLGVRRGGNYEEQEAAHKNSFARCVREAALFVLADLKDLVLTL